MRYYSGLNHFISVFKINEKYYLVDDMDSKLKQLLPGSKKSDFFLKKIFHPQCIFKY
jgi:hypothetical protein